MDAAAIQHGVDNGKSLAYTLLDTPAKDLDKDLSILEQLSEIKNPTYSQAETIIKRKYVIDSYEEINFRMREILVAIQNNRQVVKSSDILFYLVP